MKLGIHVSTSGGLVSAIDRADDLGCNTFQIFVSNPRGWAPTIVSDADVENFRKIYLERGMLDAVSHSIYLINLASNNPFFLSSSIASLKNNLSLSDRLGLSGLVTHIGSYKEESYEVGVSRVSESISDILADYHGKAKLYLENTAGAGNLIGDKFAEIGEIINNVKSEHLGFCLDTAHAFESGYTIRTSHGLEQMVLEIEQDIGLDKLGVIHLNDSMTALGSKRDRHEEFGEGEIGQEALVRLINQPEFYDKPFIMETPKLKTGEVGKEFIRKIASLQK